MSIWLFYTQWTLPSFLFFIAQRPIMCHGLLNVEDLRSHSETPHSVALLWESVQPDANTSTWQHTTLARERLPCLGGNGTRNFSKGAEADPLLRKRGHQDRRSVLIAAEYVSNTESPWLNCQNTNHRFTYSYINTHTRTHARTMN
jgi:hypothetical protein